MSRIQEGVEDGMVYLSDLNQTCFGMLNKNVLFGLKNVLLLSACRLTKQV